MTDYVERIGSTAERLAAVPYEKRVCRVEAHFPGVLDPGQAHTDLSVEDYVELISDVGFEVCIVSGEHNRGTPRFPSEMMTPHPNVENDLLPRFIEQAHAKGIIVLTYYPIIYCKPLKPKHPEWLMKMLDDGRPQEENLGWFCFNSPHRDWLADYLSDFKNHVDVDGFYFDDTNWGTHENYPFTPGCHCSYCEDLFRADTGLEIPRKVDFDSMTFKRFVSWRYEKVIDFMHHLYGEMRRRYPDLILDMNTYFWPSGDWALGHPLGSFRLEEVGSYFFVETFRSAREPGLVSKILQSTGTPFGVFRNVTQRLEGFGAAPYMEPHTPGIFSMTSIAHGGAPCGAPFGGQTIVQREHQRTVFSDLKKRVDYMGGDSFKHAALHYSTINRDFRPSERAKNTFKTQAWEIGMHDAYGAYEILNRSHVVLDIALDEHLNPKRLAQYSVLFLSNSACLGDDHCEAIRGFVTAGGTLVATFQTSLLDEWGEDRGQFALADLFGVAYEGLRANGEDHNIIYVPHDEELSKLGGVICCHGKSAEIKAGSDVEVLCTRASIDGLEGFDPKSDYDSSEPTVVRHQHGKGQVFYLAADVGGAFMTSPYPPLRRFVAELVGRAPAPLVLEGPEAVEMNAAWKEPGQLMVHLVNNPMPLVPWRIDSAVHPDHRSYEEERTTFHYTPELYPVHDLVLRFPGLKVVSARLPLQAVDLTVSGDPATVVVPKLDMHEVVLVEVGA